MLQSPTLSQLITAANQVNFKRGEIILRPFDPQKNCFIILEGMIKVYSINQQGEEEVRVIFGKDELFPLGWMAGYHTANVFFEAMTNCTLARISQVTLSEAINTNLEICRAVLHRVAQLFVVYSTRIDNLEYKYARERVAYRLLALAHRFGDTPAQDGSIVMPNISQQVLASSINVSRESVNRELSRFERLGYIHHNNGTMTIINADALRNEIGGKDENLFFDF